MKLTNGLKKLKSRIGKRTRIAILISAAAVLAAAAMGERLFNAPLKRLGPEDFQVSAQVYSVDELPAGVCYSAGENSVEITKSEDDAGKLFMVQLPSFPEAEIMLSENVIESTEYISVIQWQSPYHLLMIQYDDGGSGGDTLYVRSVKTTLLNNSAPQELQKTVSLRRIRRIVYVHDDGSETMLWQLPASIENTQP